MTNHPSDYHEDLTEERLQFVASKIMKEVLLTYDTNSTANDDSYTQGCVIFGRVRNALIAMHKSKSVDFIGLAKDGMDVTPTIGKVPFRFTTDNPDAPRKVRILRVNPEEQTQLEMAFPLNPFDEGSEIAKWRWYIKKSYSEEDSPSVVFVGLDFNDTVACHWEYDECSPIIHDVSGFVPSAIPITEAPVHVPAAVIEVKKTD